MLASLLSKFGAGRLALMAGVAAAVLVGLAYLALPDRAGPMGYLYTDLDPSSAQAIADKLRSSAVPFELSADGTAILAPQNRMAELRMSLAGERLGGKLGYEVLDNEQPFGTSAGRARLNETRAIEGELARSIETLDRVSRARVHLVLPERALFAAEPRRATASITVKTTGRLSGENIQAVRQLVASAVPELSPEAVSVVDQTGALLARAGEAGTMDGAEGDQRQAAIEARLREQIQSLLEPIVGSGRVRAEVSAEINRDQRREEASVVDPDRQAIARQVTVESNQRSDEADEAVQPASVSTQLPENAASASPPGSGESRRSSQGETSEDTSYENSRTNTVTVKAPGDVKRLTVAVMIDSGPQPLPPAQLTRLQRLVENAVGFNGERGDSVAIESMKFSAADLPSEDGFLSSLPTGELFSLLKLVILGAIALIALRLLRPMIEARLPVAGSAPATQTMLGGPESVIAGLPQELERPRLTVEDAEARGALLDQELELAAVDGRVKASAIKRIGDTVAASPGEATAVVRQWMSN